MPRLPRLVRKLARPVLEATRIHRWSRGVREPIFPDLPRKSPAEIRKDLRAWEDRFGTYDYSYFEYGADVVGRDIANYMPYAVFKAYRGASNRILTNNDDFNYECVLDDKFVFDRLARATGHPVPTLRALVSPGGFRIPGDSDVRNLHDFADVFRDTEGVLKPLVGGGGARVSVVRVSDGTVFVDDVPTDFAPHVTALGTTYVFQDLVRQHTALAQLNESSVNTVRLVTVHEAAGARPLTAALKVGAPGARVDNWVRGGLIALVDVEQGIIRGDALHRAQPSVPAHPVSGIRFDGFEIPHFARCVEAACQFHNDFYGFHTIGWDIAITDGGPVFIEGNARWDGHMPMLLDSAFVSNYLEALGPLPPTPYRHRTATLVNNDTV